MLEVQFRKEANLITASGSGRISHEDYTERLIPALEAAVKDAGKVNLLYLLGPEFEGFDMQAMWDDTRLGMTHLNDFKRIAFVSGNDLLRNAVHAMSILMPADVRVFDLQDLEQARTWASDD